MNILFMYDSPLDREKGGTERATGLVMDELNRRGHHAIGLLHFNQNNPNEIFLNREPIQSLSKFLKDNEIDVVVNQIAFHYWLLQAFLLHGGEEWSAAGGKIVSVLHFPPILVPIPIRWVFRNFHSLSLVGKIKKIGLFFYRPFLQAKAFKERRLSYRYCYDKSDAYVMLSAGFIPDLKHLGKLDNTDKVWIIPNMLTFPVIEDVSILEKKENIVLVVSRMEETPKKLTRALNVWKKSCAPDWKLLFVGDGPDLERYKRFAEKLRLRNIEFLGRRSPLEYYKKAKIFLMTSDFEGWGLTLTESLQNGVVPVAIDTVPVFHDIIEDGCNGFLVKDKNEMAKKVNELMNNNALRLRMGHQAIASSHRFLQDHVARMWWKLFEHL